MDLYRDAARKPYVLFERGSPVDAEGKPLIRWFTDPYCRYYWPGLPSCASDHAWRGVDGTPDIDVLIDLAGANLGLSRQLARDATILSLFRTVRARWIAYDDLTTALKRGLLSEAQRARCRQLLRALDPPVPTLQAIARFELAEHYDCLQVQAHEDLGSTAADIARGRFHLPFPDRTKLIASRDEAREFYGGLERLSLVPWTPQLNADIEQLKRACVRPGSHGFMAANSSVTGALQIFVRSEAERRATRLIFEIHVHRDETGAWPATLSELKGVPEEFKTDPFFGRRFIYKPVGDSFQLYSVSIDGRDNNGLHDGRWGRKIADSDYVFWPMPD